MEEGGGAEAEKTLDRLAQRQTELGCDPAVLCRADRRLLQVVPGGFWLASVEVLEECSGEDVPSFAKQDPLLVGRGDNPGKLRGDVAARPTVRARDPDRSQPGRAERWAPRAVGRQEALKRRAREPSMSTGGREHPEAAGIAPAAKRRRGDAQQPASLGQANPVSLKWLRTTQNLHKSTRT